MIPQDKKLTDKDIKKIVEQKKKQIDSNQIINK
jgi:hypothetical protein